MIIIDTFLSLKFIFPILGKFYSHNWVTGSYLNTKYCLSTSCFDL